MTDKAQESQSAARRAEEGGWRLVGMGLDSPSPSHFYVNDLGLMFLATGIDSHLGEMVEDGEESHR